MLFIHMASGFSSNPKPHKPSSRQTTKVPAHTKKGNDKQMKLWWDAYDEKKNRSLCVNCSLHLGFPSVISDFKIMVAKHKPLVLLFSSLILFKLTPPRVLLPLFLSLQSLCRRPQKLAGVKVQPPGLQLHRDPHSCLWPINTIKVYGKLVTSEGRLAESLIAQLPRCFFRGQRLVTWSTCLQL